MREDSHILCAVFYCMCYLRHLHGVRHSACLRLEKCVEGKVLIRLQWFCRELGHYAWAGVPIKRKLSEFRITDDAYLPVGTTLNAAHFVPGQYVDIQGRQHRLDSMSAAHVLLILSDIVWEAYACAELLSA